MNETPVTLKNTVELPVNPANQVSVSMGRAAVTSRTVTTVGTSVSPFQRTSSFYPTDQSGDRKAEGLVDVLIPRVFSLFFSRPP